MGASAQPIPAIVVDHRGADLDDEEGPLDGPTPHESRDQRSRCLGVDQAYGEPDPNSCDCAQNQGNEKEEAAVEAEAEEEQAAAPVVDEKTTTEEEKPVEVKKPVPEKRTGFAKVIKRSAIVIPEEVKRPPRPKKSEKKGRPAAKPKPKPNVAAKGAPDTKTNEQGAAGKGKKGKRYVKFSPDPAARERQKKGAKRKGRGEVDMADVDVFGGRLSGSLRMGRTRRAGGKKPKQHDSGGPAAETKAIKKRIKVFESISVSDFAHRMGVKGSEIIANLMALGVMEQRMVIHSLSWKCPGNFVLME